MTWALVQKLLPDVADPYVTSLAQSAGKRVVITMDLYKDEEFQFRTSSSLHASPAFLQTGAFGVLQKKIENWGLEVEAEFDSVRFNEHTMMPRQKLEKMLKNDLFSRTIKRAAFCNLSDTLKEIRAEWIAADKNAKELDKPLPPNTYSRRYMEFCAAIIGATADLSAQELSRLHLQKIGASSLIKPDDLITSPTPVSP